MKDYEKVHVLTPPILPKYQLKTATKLIFMHMSHEQVLGQRKLECLHMEEPRNKKVRDACARIA